MKSLYACLFFLLSVGALAAADRPNVVFILTDDQRGTAVSAIDTQSVAGDNRTHHVVAANEDVLATLDLNAVVVGPVTVCGIVVPVGQIVDVISLDGDVREP